MPDHSALVQDGRVHRDAYTDPAVFDVEMQRIFRDAWVYVGHDSEIPGPGDYKTTAMGVEPVVLVRGADRVARVLVNRCGHRGAAVCLRARGHATTLRCQYHGWTFGLDGALLGVPYPDGYGELDRVGLGLTGVPRMESYRGFVFASFNPAVPPLTEHLRDVLPHVDRFVDHAGSYDLQVAPDANEVEYAANWKMQLENNCDGYHLNFTHQSLFGVLQGRTGKSPRYLSNPGRATSEAYGRGHAVMDLRGVAPEMMRDRLAVLPGAPPAGADLDAWFGVPGAEALYLASTGPSVNVSIFPNLNLGSINVCEIHPIAVDRTRVVLRPVLLAGAPDAINQVRLRYHEIGSGPAGFVQPDDLEMFERIGQGLRAEEVEWLHLDRGREREEAGEGAHRIGDITDETPQRGQYRWWRELMGAGA